MDDKRKVSEEHLLEVIQRQQDRVYKLAFSYTKSTYDADDAYQMVFEKYLLYHPEFESEEHEKAWFIRVTINTCKNILSSGWKKRMVMSDETLNNCYEQQISNDNEENEKLFTAIMKLPEKLSVVIQLFYYEDYSVKQIAEILNIREGTVTTRLNRARKKLEESM